MPVPLDCAAWKRVGPAPPNLPIERAAPSPRQRMRHAVGEWSRRQRFGRAAAQLNVML